jgi:hypothetical protein
MFRAALPDAKKMQIKAAVPDLSQIAERSQTLCVDARQPAGGRLAPAAIWPRAHR